ncbi:NADH-quinone oxidoreductase subunit M [Candidatus Bathyarchaeota archaeon]|nr:NADH-quinone oxidoreductase subunit M [Candidatus Bathyarchaeota archaeon]MBS7630353.1 NADH-quinone oxidoreductase subunit M [Candidatus Bathyarchaeota archaeon]
MAPAISMPIVYTLGRKLGKNVGWVALIPLSLSSLFFIYLIPGISNTFLEEYIEWLPEIRFGLLVDSLSLPIVLTVALLSTIIVVYSIPYMEHSIHEQYHGENKKAHATYYALYLAYATSMMGVVLSTNLFQFYLFFELMIVPSWAMINIYGTGEREKIALMYLLWSIVGAVLFVTGVFTAYATVHSFEISDLVKLQGTPTAGFIVVMMLLGFSVKLATFGLHIWLPYAHAEAPTPISALLSPAMIGLAAYGIVRFLVPIRGVLESATVLTMSWGLVTMLYGGLMVMAQNDIKRMLAYSSISQMGYIFIGIASVTPLGVAGSMLHYISHGLGKAVLFLTAGTIMHQSGHRDISSMGGLAAKMPISAIAFLIGAMNISGIPPTIGFVSKFFIYTGAFSRGLLSPSIELVIAMVAIVSTALTVGYTMWNMRRIFYGPFPEHLKGVKEAPALMTVPMMILCFLSILLGIYPGQVLDPLIEAVKQMISI